MGPSCGGFRSLGWTGAGSQAVGRVAGRGSNHLRRQKVCLQVTGSLVYHVRWGEVLVNSVGQAGERSQVVWFVMWSGVGVPAS